MSRPDLLRVVLVEVPTCLAGVVLVALPMLILLGLVAQ